MASFERNATLDMAQSVREHRDIESVVLEYTLGC